MNAFLCAAGPGPANFIIASTFSAFMLGRKPCDTQAPYMVPMASAVRVNVLPGSSYLEQKATSCTKETSQACTKETCVVILVIIEKTITTTITIAITAATTTTATTITDVRFFPLTCFPSHRQ